MAKPKTDPAPLAPAAEPSPPPAPPATPPSPPSPAAPDPRLAEALALLRALVSPCQDVIARDPAWPGRPFIEQAKALLLTE